MIGNIMLGGDDDGVLMVSGGCNLAKRALAQQSQDLKIVRLYLTLCTHYYHVCSDMVMVFTL